MIRRSSSAIQNQWTVIQEGQISLRRMYDFLDESASKEYNSSKQVAPIITAIRLKHVSFHYLDGHSVLDDVSITLNMHETVLISGVNGAGKSTLINLILGFYSPSSGKILINDLDYNQLDIASIRSQIGYLPQHQILIEGTIRENIFYGLSNPDQNIHLPDTLVQQLLSGFSEGLETKISPLGKNLSKGQIQRISILRCLILKPKLLLLDEPTNHLDVASIAALIGQIKKMEKMSVLIISHSYNLRALADVSYEINEGKLSVHRI
jgi:ABC-type bacteriocin/lantibiotic exporter with double-glycine peptidase domain